MVGAVKKWQKSDTQKSQEIYRKLSQANSALETQLNILSKLAEDHWDAYKCVIHGCSMKKSEKVFLILLLKMEKFLVILKCWSNIQFFIQIWKLQRLIPPKD